MTESGIRSWRGIAHIIANDPGLYYKTQFGCVAYIGGHEMPYGCCNDRIEDFDLQASRNALLKILTISNRTNLQHFIRMLQCRRHRVDQNGIFCDTILAQWWREIGCRADDHSHCSNCSLIKPRPRWDAGFREPTISPKQKTTPPRQAPAIPTPSMVTPPPTLGTPTNRSAGCPGVPQDSHEDGMKVGTKDVETQTVDIGPQSVSSTSKEPVPSPSAAIVVILLILSIVAWLRFRAWADAVDF